MYTQKNIKVTLMMDPTVLEQMKVHLKQVNENKTMMHISQSDYVTEAVKQLLAKAK